MYWNIRSKNFINIHKLTDCRLSLPFVNNWKEANLIHKKQLGASKRLKQFWNSLRKTDRENQYSQILYFGKLKWIYPDFIQNCSWLVKMCLIVRIWQINLTIYKMNETSIQSPRRTRDHMTFSVSKDFS